MNWTFRVPEGTLFKSPAISNKGDIYLSCWNNRFYALNSSGHEKWNFTTGDMVDTPPTIGDDGMIYFGSRDNKLYALDEHGNEKWNFTAEKWIRTSPSIDHDGMIYFGSHDNNLYALYKDGRLKWSLSYDPGPMNSPIISREGTIYIGSSDRHLFAVAPDGSLLWAFKTGSHIAADPVIWNETRMYLPSTDGYLYAIGSGEVPSTPSNFRISPGNSSVNMTWEAPEDDGGSPVLSYLVYKGDSKENLSYLTTIFRSNNFTDHDVKRGVDTCYQISALNNIGEGPGTEILTVSIPEPPFEETDDDKNEGDIEVPDETDENEKDLLVLIIISFTVIICILLLAFFAFNMIKKRHEP